MPWVHRVVQVDADGKTGVCAKCGSVSLKRKSSRHGKDYYVCRPGYNEREARRKREPHEHSVYYRKYLKDHCERCNFVAEHRCQLDIHHIDGDHSNNDPTNLQTLCANCHRLVTLKQKERPPA